MKSSDSHPLSHSTNALLSVLRSFGNEKQIHTKDFWLLLLKKIAEFDIEGEIFIFQEEKKEPIYRTPDSSRWKKKALFGNQNIYKEIFEKGKSFYLSEKNLKKLSSQGIIKKRIRVLQKLFRGIKPTIYSPLAYGGKTVGVLAISAENLSPADVPATEALCQHLTLLWHTSSKESYSQPAVTFKNIYQETLKQSNEASFIYQFDGSLITANHQMANFVGYSEKELSAMTIFDIISPDYHEACREKISKLQKGEPVEVNQRRLIHKQGHKIPVEINDTVVFSAHSEPLYIMGNARDITQRVQNEKALKESKERYQRLVDASPLGVLVYINEKIVYTNHNAGRLLGVKHQDKLLGKSIFDFFPSSTVENTKKWLQKVENNGDQKHIPKVAVVRQDGQEIFLDIYLSYITYNAQKAVQVVFSDITANIKIEKTLKKTAKDLERRAVQLQVAAEIARDATKERSLKPLLNKAVDLIKKRFGFYHAALFLIDKENKYAVLTAASGETGQKMIEQEHRLQVGKEGIVGYVAGSGEARIALDVGKDAVHFENTLLPKTRSEMAVPLNVGDKIIGVLDVQSQHAAAFDTEDIHVIETMADQLAVAIQNVQLLEATWQNTRQLRGLYETSLATSSVLDTEKILSRFYIQIDRLMSPDSFLIGLWDENAEEIMIASAIEDGKEETEFIGRKFPVPSEGLLSWIVTNRKYLLIKNIDEEKLPTTPIKYGRKVFSWLGVPLISRDRLIGVVTVQAFEANRFDEEDRRFLEAISAQVASALENARLFEAEEQERKQAQVLREAARVISSLLSLDDVIEAVLDQLAKVLTFDRGNIMLVEGKRLHVKGGRGYGEYAELLPNASFSLERQHLKEILQKKKNVLIKDTEKASSWVQAKFGIPVRSWLGVPILVRDKVIGILGLDRVAPGGFTPKEVEIAEIFATHTAAAIENARLFENIEQRARELESVHQASLSLTANLRPEEVFDSILKSVFTLMSDVEDAHIFLYDGSSLFFSAFLNQNGSQEGPIAVPRPNGLTYQVARKQEAIWVSDMKTHPLYEDVAAQKGWEGAILGLPLMIGDRTVGVMNVAFNQAREFRPSELRTLNLLSDQAAIAIENARLFEQVTIERGRTSLLYDIAQKLVTSLEFDTILDHAIGTITRSLGGTVGIAKLYNKETKTLEDYAIYGRNVDIRKKAKQLKLGEGLTGWAAENQESVYVPDVRQDNRWIYVKGLDCPQGAILVSPILSGEDLLGILSIQSDTVESFSEEHLDLLNAISRQVSLALSNARRYRDVNRLVEQLEGEQHRQKSLIEGLPIGVLLLGEDYRLKIINTLGKEFIETLSAPVKVGDIITHVGQHSLSELIARSEKPLPVDIKIEGPPSKIFEFQLRSITNDIQQWVIALQDVTGEREAQERINMQDRLATVGKLAAGIGHDFNNILAAILVYTELLLKEKNLPSKFETRLNVIRQQTERASKLVRQMSDFSRSSVMEEKQIDIRSFLEELEGLLVRTIPESIRVSLQSEAGEYLVSVDPTRLQQVFMNLAVNARDAMPYGGHLNFDLSYLYHSEESTNYPFLSVGDWVKITVQDTGIGIPEDVLPHIFEPFFTTKEVGEGTGLGLAQVFGIIKQFDGHIDVKSAEGKGTTFTVFLPKVAIIEKEEQKEIENNVTITGLGQRVLLVEDNIPTQQALKAMLEMSDYQVTTASNGLEALEIIQNNNEPFEFVVSDIVMPEMGGVELYHEMQAMWPGLQIIFVTGHPLHGREKKLLAQDNVSWLQKPFTIQDFNQLLKEVLE